MHDETDLQLVNLLQIDPRMPWARAGEILGISATTAANRWKRLRAEGLAWISTYPNLEAQFTAVVEVDCRTEQLPSVIERLCHHPMVVSVDECTGMRDLLVLIIAPDMGTLTSLVIDWIGSLEGVHGTRSSLVTEVIAGGESWRLNAINRQQAWDAATHVGLGKPPAGHGIDVALVEALAEDGRASVASLAQLLDVPTSTIQRRLARLRVGRQVTMRCDISPILSGLLLECTWLTTVAPNHKPRIAELLKETSPLTIFWTTGLNNLSVTFRVSHVRALATHESTIVRSLPGLTQAEMLVHLRSHKSMGWLLDSQGRATGQLVVPVFAS
jgi:DNA-binding Lrp family transcriptional regulator